MASKRTQPPAEASGAGVRLQFGAALRKLAGLADALTDAGALTEMTGAEFVAYGAEQLALASIEPKDASAARLSALKSAIASATEQSSDADPVVYVKVYDSDDARLTQVETLLAQCKSALGLLSADADAGAIRSPRTQVVRAMAPRSGDPIRDAYADDEDDDLDSDVFDDMDAETRAAVSRQESDALLEDDADDLDAHIAAIEQRRPVRSRPSGYTEPRESAPRQLGRRLNYSEKLRPGDKDPVTGIVIQNPAPKRSARPMSPLAVANALARGESGSPKLQTARAGRRGR